MCAKEATYKTTHYPKPGQIGGRLIRRVIALMKDQGVALPIGSDILIATSGGCDSMALAHLICNYGRRVAPHLKISLLHINHGWRGKVSDGDEAFVREAADRWRVGFIGHKLNPEESGQVKGESWEALAREARKRIFSDHFKSHHAVVLTAHHADDLAETVLWRILTGAAETHGGGICFRHGNEIRPLLTTRKAELVAYLNEVGQSFREDETNSSGRFLRAQMRARLMPEVERLFPKAIDHLVKQGLEAQLRPTALAHPEQVAEQVDPTLLLGVAGLGLRRSYFQQIREKLVAKKPWYGEIHLSGGWKLSHENLREKAVHRPAPSLISKEKKVPSERWILERSQEERS